MPLLPFSAATASYSSYSESCSVSAPRSSGSSSIRSASKTSTGASESILEGASYKIGSALMGTKHFSHALFLILGFVVRRLYSVYRG